MSRITQYYVKDLASRVLGRVTEVLVYMFRGLKVFKVFLDEQVKYFSSF